MTNILILAANDTKDPADAGYPICLTEFGTSTLLETIAYQVSALENAKLTVALRDADARKWHFDSLVANFPLETNVHRIPGETAGATCTALLAAAKMEKSESLLILNGNEHLNVDYASTLWQLSDEGVDAGLLYFDSNHPRYSFVRLDENGFVLETAEKRPITRNATVGFYWFKSVASFVENASRQLLKSASVDGKYYICPVMNEVILSGGQVKALRIPNEDFIPLKTLRQLSKFEGKKEH